MQIVQATDEFAITWPDPSMAEAPWLGDRMHFPNPVVQLGQHIVGGFQERVTSAPTVFANGYQFSLPPTLPDLPPDDAAKGLAVWSESYAPRIREFCKRVRSTDFDSMSNSELSAALDTLSDEMLDGMHLTLAVVKSFMEPTFAMLLFLEEQLGEDGPVLAGTLLQGFKNATAASGEGLRELAKQAAQSAPLAEALRAGNQENLDQVPGGKELLAGLSEFLEEFGWRAETWGTLQRPTWAEDQSEPLTLIGRYLSETEEESSSERSAEQREAALAEVESRLEGETLTTFRNLHDVTLQHVSVSEDRARWQLSLVGVMRLPALALGRKLTAAGALEKPEDVFYLTIDEAKRAASDTGDWVGKSASAGAAEYARWETLSPPPFLGSPPDPAQIPPEMLPLLKHFLGIAPPSVEGNVITGAAASKGVVTGRARVIRHLDESDKLEDGDILVCITTAPPWTGIMAISSAVVTDTGGVMSHSGICARELAIPCVVGTQVGTSAIPDGATITVDGEKGTVTIS